MNKHHHIKAAEQRLNRTAPDEAPFLLCATDPATPAAIAAWLKSATAIGVPRLRLADAADHLLEILDFQHQHPERLHVPGTQR